MESMLNTSETVEHPLETPVHGVPVRRGPLECNILVVDDNVIFAKTLRYAIEGSMPEATVIASVDPRKALDLLHETAFEVILCDYRMPQMNGVEFIARAFEMAPLTPVILMSGVDDIKLALKARSGGAFDLVLKPVDRESVIPLLQRAIATYRERIAVLPA